MAKIGNIFITCKYFPDYFHHGGIFHLAHAANKPYRRKRASIVAMAVAHAAIANIFAQSTGLRSFGFSIM